MIAVKRLQSQFWVLFVALGALSAYLVSLKVATERNELMRVRAQIASARGDIRYLETEFSARANMRQLEQWASRDFHYSALGADHYLTDERQLAHLDGLQPNGPNYAPQPVLVAMIETGDREQADAAASQAQADVAATTPVRVAVQAPVAPVASVSAPAPVPAPKAVKQVKDSPKDRAPAAAVVRLAKADRSVKAAPVSRKAERMAMLDAQLLDSRSLGKIDRAVR